MANLTKDEIISAQAEEISMLKSKISALMKTSIMLSQEDKYKLALRLHATGLNISNVYSLMTTKYNITIEIEELEALFSQLDFLDDGLREHYDKAKSEFLKKATLDKSYFIHLLYRKYQHLEASIGILLTKALECGDNKLALDCTARLTTLYKELSSSYFKNSLGDELDDSILKLQENYEEAKNPNPNKNKKLAFKNLSDKVKVI